MGLRLREDVATGILEDLAEMLDDASPAKRALSAPEDLRELEMCAFRALMVLRKGGGVTADFVAKRLARDFAHETTHAALTLLMSRGDATCENDERGSWYYPTWGHED